MQPKWTEGPRAGAALPHLPLRRAPAGANFSGIITCERFLWVPTHYWRGRTLPCIENDCPGCADKLPTRDEGYVSVWSPSSNNHVIFALTPAAWTGINDTAPNLQNVRGLKIHFARIGKRANARLNCRCEVVELAQLQLPSAPDLKEHMLRIWGLDRSHAAADNPGYANRVTEHYRKNGKHADA